jgi:hypothetical protein
MTQLDKIFPAFATQEEAIDYLGGAEAQHRAWR